MPHGLISIQLPNGPKDGGLAVLEGSFKLYNQFFEEHINEMPEGGWDWKDSFNFTDKHMQWFFDRGCKWQKIVSNPGDVILWDSRCVHYGASPESDAIRAAVCEFHVLCISDMVIDHSYGISDVCYKPAKDITPEFVEKRKDVMDNLLMTVSVYSGRGKQY